MAQSALDEEPYAETRLMRDYLDAIVAYPRNGGEDEQSRAYDIGRSALQCGVPIVTLSNIHNEAARGICAQCPADQQRFRLEQFFLETVTVYDMAQHGYREAVTRMRDEITERKKVEEELRDATFELVRQRDDLDALVQERTLEIQRALDELHAVNARLLQANQEQAEFTYALSHDLKSPLNTISMMLSISGALQRRCIILCETVSMYRWEVRCCLNIVATIIRMYTSQLLPLSAIRIENKNESANR